MAFIFFALMILVSANAYGFVSSDVTLVGIFLIYAVAIFIVLTPILAAFILVKHKVIWPLTILGATVFVFVFSRGYFESQNIRFLLTLTTPYVILTGLIFRKYLIKKSNYRNDAE